MFFTSFLAVIFHTFFVELEYNYSHPLANFNSISLQQPYNENTIFLLFNNQWPNFLGKVFGKFGRLVIF